jgi:hypothetical protein
LALLIEHSTYVGAYLHDHNHVSKQFILTTICLSSSVRAALNEALTGEVQRLKHSATAEHGDAGSSSNLAQQMQLRCQNQMLELHKQQQQIPFYQLEQPEQNGAASRTHESK